MGLGHSPRIVTDGLVLCLDAASKRSYPGTGTTWTDLKGGNNGTLTNGPTFSSDNGGRIVFDGTDDEIQLSSPISFNGNSASICAWCTKSGIIAAGSNYNQGYHIYIEGTSTYQNWGGGFLNFGNPTSLGLLGDDPRYVTVIKDYTNSVEQLYVNGELKSSISNSSLKLNNCFIKGFGRLYYNSGSHVNSNMSFYSCQIYNRALTAEEVLQNYLATKERYA